jgi:hypothetical protein
MAYRYFNILKSVNKVDVDDTFQFDEHFMFVLIALNARFCGRKSDYLKFMRKARRIYIFEYLGSKFNNSRFFNGLW